MVNAANSDGNSSDKTDQRLRDGVKNTTRQKTKTLFVRTYLRPRHIYAYLERPRYEGLIYKAWFQLATPFIICWRISNLKSTVKRLSCQVKIVHCLEMIANLLEGGPPPPLALACQIA